jgi:hypothetical protein
MNRSANIVGAVMLICGVAMLVVGIRGLLSGEPARGGDLAAAIVFAVILLAISCALLGFEAGQEIDERGRRVVRWTRWRGFARRESSIPFDSVTRLRLHFMPGAKYSPPVWRIMAERHGDPAIEVGRRVDLDEALDEGRRLAARIGAPFPQGLTEWSGRDGDVNCTVSLGSEGLTVGEFTDDPHQLNDTMTVGLEEFLARKPHGRGESARNVIRDRLGVAILTEIDETISMRLRSKT